MKIRKRPLSTLTKTGEQEQEAIGIIGAMDEEVTDIKEKMTISRRETIASMEFFEGTIGNKKVVVVQCGMGKVNATICAHTLINSFGCSRIIFTGVAGSLDARLDIGDIVVSKDAVQHDFTVEAIGFKKGEIPYTGLYAFPADETLIAEAVKAAQAIEGIAVHEGRICSGDQFVTDHAQQQKIIDDFGGLCCEMEGAAVAQTCYLNNTPFVIIRSISDKPDGSGTVDFETFKGEAGRRSADIVFRMVADLN